MWRDIKKIIKKHHQFLLTTHVNPDGDGIGAACALTELLMEMGKKVRFVVDSPIPHKFDFLDYHGIYERYDSESDYSAVQVVIILDTHKKERIGRVAQLVEKPGMVTICIDHHEVEKSFTPYQVMDAKACSVGAMIYSFYKESGFLLTLPAATGIYTSVICDTGRFCYSSTNFKAHKIAEDCIKSGVDPDLMHARLFQHVSLAQTKLFIHTLQSMEMHFENQLAIQQILQKDCRSFGSEVIDIEHIDLDYIHDFNHSIEEVRCFILLREIDENNIRVSLRSKTDLDISDVVHALGGGGHPNAAGLSWHGSLGEIKSRLLELLGPLLLIPVITNI